MAQYGEVRVDYLTYTTGVSPSEGSATTTISGLVNSPTFSGDVNVEGNLVVNNSLTVSGDIIASGVTISGITGLFASGIETAPSIAFVDDTDTGFYNSATNEIRIVTNGNDRLTIDDTGNVGIGTTSPANSIHIKSSVPALRLEDTNWSGSHLITDNANGDLLFTANASNTLGVDSNIRFQIANAERARIDSSGNVGIGTTSPEALLHIVPGNVGTTAIGGRDINYGANLQTSSGRSGFLVRVNNNFTNDSDNSGFMWLYPFDTGGNNNYKVFRSATGSTLVDKFWVNQAGGGYFASNVGIGTTSPDSRFEVLDDSATGIISRSTNTQSTNTNKALKVRNNSDTDTFNVSYKGQGYFADSVGIGTTSPSSELHVQGNLSGGQLLVTTSTTNSTQKYGTIGTLHYTNAEQPALGLAVQSNSTDNNVLIGGALGQFNAATNVRFYTAGNNTTTTGTERARIDGAGRLLVGTSSAPSGPDGITPKIASASVGGATAAADLQIAAYQAAGGSGRAKVSGKLFLGHSRSGVSGALGGVVLSGDNLGEVRFWGDDGTNAITAAEIVAQVDGTPGTNDMPGRIVLSTTATGASTPTERMRINNGGSTTVFSSLGNTFISRSSTSAGTTDNLFAGLHSATSTTNGTQSFVVRTNGNVQNTNDSYGAISDIKLKENIVDAESQWDDFKAVRFRKYNFKEETGHETFTQLGVIAQELELVSPGLVTETPDLDEDGNDLGTTTKSVKYSVLTKKALVALQEAMDRIEQLETSNADLLARVTALEGN